MDMRQIKCACVVFALCFGSSSAYCETPNGSTTSEYPGNRHGLAIQEVKPYRFTRPRDEARGLRVVMEAIGAPNGPRSDSLTDGYFTAVLGPALRQDWDIVSFNVYEIAGGERESRRLEPSFVIPSQCNDHCNNETRYCLANLKSDCRYRVEYLLWPRTSTANPTTAITSLRSTSRDALTVKVWYEFAVPEKFVGGAASRDALGGAQRNGRGSIHD